LSVSQNSEYHSTTISLWPRYLFSLLMVTTHSLYHTSVWSNHHSQVTHCSFRHASPHLWNQLPTSLRIPHPNYSSPLSDPH